MSYYVSMVLFKHPYVLVPVCIAALSLQFLPIAKLVMGIILSIVYLFFVTSDVLMLSLIILGAVFWSDCPRQPFIPIYLVVAGSGSLVLLTYTTILPRRTVQYCYVNHQLRCIFDSILNSSNLK